MCSFWTWLQNCYLLFQPSTLAPLKTMTFSGLLNFFNQNSDSDEETSLEASQKSRKPKSGKSSKIKRSHSVDNDRNSKDKRQKIDSSPFVRNPKTSKNVMNIRRERLPSVEIIEELPVTKTTRYSFNKVCSSCKLQSYCM